MNRRGITRSKIIYTKIRQLEREIHRLKKMDERGSKRNLYSLRGILGKVSISNLEIGRAKKSLFPLR